MNQIGLFDARHHARQLMQKYFDIGISAQQQLVDRVANLVIRDRLVQPASMQFFDDRHSIVLRYPDASVVRLHKHAFTQLAQKIGVPLVYANKLRTGGTYWESNLLCIIFNKHFENAFKKEQKFLHRIVGDELRGFLSSRFNRHLASEPLLGAFIGACQEERAQPVDAYTSDVRFALKCFHPHVFEATENEFVAVGVEWSNSDFGAGKMTVCQTVWRINSNTKVVLDETISRVHLGSVITETDIEMSEETLSKEVATQMSAIRDAVKQQLSHDSIDRLLGAIRKASEEDVPWTKLKGQLSRFLQVKEMEALGKMLDEPVIDLPPVKKIDGKNLPNRWWLSNALGHLANKTDDPERQADLQHEAGRFLADMFGKEG